MRVRLYTGVPLPSGCPGPDDRALPLVYLAEMVLLASREGGGDPLALLQEACECPDLTAADVEALVGHATQPPGPQQKAPGTLCSASLMLTAVPKQLFLEALNHCPRKGAVVQGLRKGVPVGDAWGVSLALSKLMGGFVGILCVLHYFQKRFGVRVSPNPNRGADMLQHKFMQDISPRVILKAKSKVRFGPLPSILPAVSLIGTPRGLIFLGCPFCNVATSNHIPTRHLAPATMS